MKHGGALGYHFSHLSSGRCRFHSQLGGLESQCALWAQRMLSKFVVVFVCIAFVGLKGAIRVSCPLPPFPQWELLHFGLPMSPPSTSQLVLLLSPTGTGRMWLPGRAGRIVLHVFVVLSLHVPTQT